MISSEDKSQEINLSTSTKAETAIDIAGTAFALAPWIGGAISNVLAGLSMNRKMGRIETCLKYLSERIEKVRSEKAEDFVKTEDFEGLLEHTLKKVADERIEEKRKLYGLFILNNIAMPEVGYEERLKMLKMLEEIQPAHIELIKALLKAPSLDELKGPWGSSIIRTLSRRLPEYSEEFIIELTNDIEQLRLIVGVAKNLKTLLTHSGASDLASRVTDFGRKFLNFLVEDELRFKH